MKIVDAHELGYSDLTRFTNGYSAPLFRVMHHKSAGSSGSLNWSEYPLSGDTPLDDLRHFCHYEEAIPCLSGLSFDQLKILIIGSSVPWLECLVAGKGASEILTVEYRPINWSPMFSRTSWSSIVFDDFARLAPEKKYDVLISYSSIEHSGLGRYGDPIDPDGDLLTMSLCSRWLLDGGRVFVAVPVGRDAVLFNRHRVYGRERLSSIARIIGKSIINVVPPASEYADEFPPHIWSIEHAETAPAPPDRPVYDRQLLLEFCS